MTVETTPAAPAPAAAAPAAKPAKQNLPLFDKPAPKTEVPPVVAAEAKPEAEAAPVVDATTVEAAAEPPKPAAVPPKKRERPGVDMARLATDKKAAEAAKVSADAARAEADKEKAAAAAERADFERKKAMVKEDPRALLALYDVKFEDLSKRVLNGAPLDPRTLELKAELDQMRGEMKRQAERIEADKKERETQAKNAQVQVQVERLKGQISAALEAGDDYEQCRAEGYTPEYVLNEMLDVYKATGRELTHKEALDLLESGALEKLDRTTKTKKALAKLKPAPAAAPALAVAAKPVTTPGLNNGSGGPVAKKEVEIPRSERWAKFFAEKPLFK